ncbi:3-hydroxybutyryl-CoA dehydrogenase [Desulfosarcina widdelii]|uniref:3-hydroxybutyryl-CoA dehydrogenase n=1 Tax=Desulfosarcina widdelii TaxID=947919 RepID=A0A5K7Z6V9_9BACT|nr:3-hydroxyacyl-CoA dehydrogenase family protein [Desulfosarcina widdelii]BBO75949.1 3-hydroxybutyryl-CoA dehydrogenase [Desulfosarcina widdelii]
MDIKTIGVIGSGIMGHGIAQVAATAGIPVKLNDISESVLEKARTNIDRSLDKGIKRGKISQDDKAGILGRICFECDFKKAVENVDLVVEAVPENIELKSQIFQKLDQFSSSDTILASNTSQYSITEIASVVSDPSRVIGMHWFNPPVIMKLIEIVRALDTSDTVVESIRAFAAKVGKDIVVCKDSTGFISTRVLLALRLECYRLLEEGIATKEDIDKTLKLAFGHPMGQFELADFSGLDIEVPSCESLAKVFGDRFRPPQALLQRVKAGRFGRKTGRGWYDYE